METQPNNLELINPKKKILKKYLGKGGPAGSGDDTISALKNSYYKRLKYFKTLDRIAKTTNLGG